MSELDESIIGDWQLKRDTPMRLEGSTFTLLSAGAVLAVKQVDNKSRKVLVEIGPGAVDWVDQSFLEEYCERLL